MTPTPPAVKLPGFDEMQALVEKTFAADEVGRVIAIVLDVEHSEFFLVQDYGPGPDEDAQYRIEIGDFVAGRNPEVEISGSTYPDDVELPKLIADDELALCFLRIVRDMREGLA